MVKQVVDLGPIQRPGEKHGLADTNLTSRRVIKGDDGADGHEPKEATTRGKEEGVVRGWRASPPREGVEGVEMKGAWLEKCEPPSPRIHFHTSTPSKWSRCDRPTDRPTDRRRRIRLQDETALTREDKGNQRNKSN